jgi:alkylhydroperoxidase/carboxymuconolactone decarboxylase family protein YurZ
MKPQDFNEERKQLTDLALEKANLGIKRFYALDNATYTDGALDAKTKEMLGLTASMVLRCDDCIRYHLGM